MLCTSSSGKIERNEVFFHFGNFSVKCMNYANWELILSALSLSIMHTIHTVLYAPYDMKYCDVRKKKTNSINFESCSCAFICSHNLFCLQNEIFSSDQYLFA